VSSLPPEGAGPPWGGPAAGLAPTHRESSRGFTLIELLVVIAIIAIATAGVAFSVRDSADSRLEREAQRLAALLESGRAQSRSSGVPVRWTTTQGGFRFDGLPATTALPTEWLYDTTQAQGNLPLLLGPEPIIGRQEVQLTSGNAPGRSLLISTDGLRPFSVTTPEVPQ
jgi:general secretion pathway protein H